MSYIIKIGFIGDCNVGKTSIINKYLRINKISEVTLGVDFKNITKIYQDIKFKLHIWDTSGQEKFKSIVSSYYRDLDVILLIFDSSDIKTFNNIKTWLNEIDKFENKDYIKILVGNKTDKNNLVINNNMASRFAEENDLYFYQTTIIIDKSIDHLFDEIIKITYNKLVRNEILLKSFVDYDNLVIDENKILKKKNNCCLIQ